MAMINPTNWFRAPSNKEIGYDQVTTTTTTDSTGGGIGGVVYTDPREIYGTGYLTYGSSGMSPYSGSAGSMPARWPMASDNLLKEMADEIAGAILLNATDKQLADIYVKYYKRLVDTIKRERDMII